MAKNESKLDRLVRLAVGIVLIALAFWLEGNGLTVTLYVAGIVVLLSAVTGFCSLYRLFAFSTLQK